MKSLSIIISGGLFLTSLIFGQNAANTSRRIDSSKAVEPQALQVAKQNKSKKDGSKDLSESDTGAQRPILLKTKGISAFFGYDSKYYYQSNPFATTGVLKSEIATGVWRNTFYGGAGLGVFDMDSYVLTPYIGGSWSVVDYLKSDPLLEAQNYNSTSAYALFLAQFGNGWSAKAGVRYGNDRTSENDQEVFKEFYPSIGIMKTDTLSDSLRSALELGLGYHNNSVDPLFADDNGKGDSKRNWDISASYSLEKSISVFTVTPKYKLTYRDYQNGSNKDRDDLVHELSATANYSVTDSLMIKLSYGYTNQDASIDTFDYENYDAGGSLTLNARF